MPMKRVRWSLVIDLAVVCLIAVLFYLLARLFDLAEQISQLLHRAESVELDELLVVSIILIPLLLVVVWRLQVRAGRAAHLQAQLQATEQANRALEQEVHRRIEVEHSLREMIHENELHLREINSIYETAPVGLCSVDRDLRFERVNQRLADMNGIPLGAHLGRTLPELLPHLADRLIPLYRSVLATGRPVLDLEVESAIPANPALVRSWVVSYYPLTDTDGTVIGVNGVVFETTERKRVEREAKRVAAEIERVQKLEGLDVLVGGIAHDFNNLLLVILANLDLCRDTDGLPDAARDNLQEAEAAGYRAAAVCRELLTYTGRSRPVFELFNLNELVRGVTRMLRATTPERVMIVTREWPRKVPVEGDESQITQVVMNLVINAVHAIGDRDGKVELDLTVDPAGGVARLTCADDGCGMDAATLDRLFEPFFSSKPSGRGLGLAAAKGILKRHDGTITVSSRPGVGSLFTLTLPLAKGARRSGVTAAPLPRGLAEQVFLVVDDDPNVRKATAAGLAKRGAAVLEATGGEAACALASSDGRELSGCLIDYHMPGISGVETYRRLRRLHPTVPVILISGNLVREVEEAVAGDRHATTLQKPYSLSKALEVFDALSLQPAAATDRPAERP